jgi:hypothetical protein
MLLRVLGLTPKVNFINVLLASFTLADPNSAKKTNCFTVFFVLSGFSYEKAALRMLMKLTPDFVLKWKEREEEAKNRDFPLSFVFILTQGRTTNELKRQRSRMKNAQKMKICTSQQSVVVDCTSVLPAAFARKDPKSAKRQ